MCEISTVSAGAHFCHQLKCCICNIYTVAFTIYDRPSDGCVGFLRSNRICNHHDRQCLTPEEKIEIEEAREKEKKKFNKYRKISEHPGNDTIGCACFGLQQHELEPPTIEKPKRKRGRPRKSRQNVTEPRKSEGTYQKTEG